MKINSRSGVSTGQQNRFGKSDRQTVLRDWNDTAFSYRRESTVVEQFEARAIEAPDALAAVFGDTRLTYGELSSRSSRLARYLMSEGVGREVPVGICLTRSPELLIGMLAILKAGGAYVPIDPVYPEERALFMLEDTGAPIVLTESSLSERLSGASARVIRLNRDSNFWDGQSAEPMASASGPDDLAYVIYTSGSTGQPKGVEVEHGSLCNLTSWHQRVYSVASGDRATQVAGLGFDACVWELWPYLTAGASVWFPDDETRGTPGRLWQWLAESGITITFMPTPMAEAALQQPLPEALQLRYLLTGGDRLNLRPQEPLPFELVNHYGPTENTVVSTSAPVPVGLEHPAPIGRPIQNVRTYVLDEQAQPVPVGEPGELYVAGSSLARGYRNRPELTAERFLPDPFIEDTSARMYRTGDIVRWLPDGQIEFIGRDDDQVKIRGYRIELGEIDSTLMAQPGIRQAVTMALEDTSGDKRLVAYIVGEAAADDSQPGEAVLRENLKRTLPDYMVPSSFVLLDEFPLTANGKVDRSALPTPDLASAREYVPPRTPVEASLAEIFAELLGVDRVGADDNFFELGGHSIKAMQLAGRIRERLGAPLTVDQLFDLATVAAMADAVDRVLSGESEGAPAITPRQPAPQAPTSFAQRRIWFIQQLDPTNLSYNYQGAIRFEGILDKEILARCLTEIVRRHEIYRTTFPEIDGEPVQHVHEPWPVELDVVDLTDQPEASRFDEAQRMIHKLGRDPYDLAELPLVKWFLIRLSDDDHLLAHLEHHIVHDGWSLNVLLNEIVETYRAYSTDSRPDLPDLDLQFSDFAIWERKRLEGGDLEQGLDYWQKQLGGCPELLDLPTDRPRTARQTFDGALVERKLPATLAREIRKVSRAADSTLFATMQAAFALLLSRYAGQNDVCIGAGIANRHWQTEHLIGMFINNIVLRHDLSGDPSFSELQRRARTIVQNAHRYHYVPFEKVVQAINAARSQGHNPLFQVMLSFHDAPLPRLDVPGLKISHQELVHNGSAKFDLNVICIPRREQRTGRTSDGGEEIDMFWEFNSNLFDRATVERFADTFERLLQAVVADPDRRLSDYDLLTADERRRIVSDFNDTTVDYPRDSSIVAEFERQARETPDAPALDSEEGSISYSELNARSNRLAHHLKAMGVVPEQMVGLCVERSIEMVVGILGILKAGGAYVPLDPEYPASRLEFMLEDIDASVVVTVSGLLDRLPLGDATAVCLDRDAAEIDRLPSENPGVETGPRNLAYVIYTSGSTGEPKGTCVEHRSVLRLVRNTDFMELGPDEVFLQFAPISFDASTLELWGPLLNGGRLVLSPPRSLSLDELGDLIERSGVTSLWLTAGLFHQMVDHRLDSFRGVRQMLAGGDVLSPSHVKRYLKTLDADRCLINGYGPTENTTFTCCHVMRAASEIGHTVPIGRPIANTRVYVLDGDGRPCPIGVPGELCIGGDGVARGYHNRNELSAARFVDDPFSDDPDARMYRTGDIVRWRLDGTIEFLGRDDDQVKVRGYRIEPGEIESAMAAHPAVRQAVVVAREDTPGDKRLVGYYIAEAEADGSSAIEQSLREKLKQRLPDYMVPAAFVALDEFPLTPNGKVDRSALPAPDFASAREYVAPRTPVEETLAEIFSDVLGVERVGIHDDFFELGGHSLMATQVVSRVRQSLAFEAPLSALFDFPTVAEFSSGLETSTTPSRFEEGLETFEL